MLINNSIKFNTSETVFSDVMSDITISHTVKVNKRNYDVMRHHYIYKGKWSVCWTTDCTEDCPNDKCWEATSNNLMCQNCNSELKGKSKSCVMVNNSDKRKLAEEVECNKKLTKKLVSRLKMLFEIPEVVQTVNKRL